VTGHSVFRLSLALDEIFWYAHGLAPRARKPRPSEKIGPRVSPGPPPRGHPSSDHQSRGGAGSARPQGAHGLDRGMCPVGQGPLASSSGENGMPRHSWGLTTRTRRPRPSEKITPRIVSRSSPQGHPSLQSAPRGGAGSARPQGAHGLDRGMCPVGQGPLASSSGENGTPRHSWGLTTRTRRPRPSEKITPRIVSRSSPQGHPSLRSPPRGGGGSASPRGRPNLLPVYSHSTTHLSPSHRR
jgi:hypothetical protein